MSTEDLAVHCLIACMCFLMGTIGVLILSVALGFINPWGG